MLSAHGAHVKAHTHKENGCITEKGRGMKKRNALKCGGIGLLLANRHRLRCSPLPHSDCCIRGRPQVSPDCYTDILVPVLQAVGVHD